MKLSTFSITVHFRIFLENASKVYERVNHIHSGTLDEGVWFNINLNRKWSEYCLLQTDGKPKSCFFLSEEEFYYSLYIFFGGSNEIFTIFVV